MQITLGQLAEKIQAKLKGDPGCVITGIATLQAAGPGQLTFLSNTKYRKFLSETKASAVIVIESDAAYCQCHALIVADPYYALAKLAEMFLKTRKIKPGIHKTAVIGENCEIDSTASIGAHVVIGNHVKIGARTCIEAHTVIGDRCALGDDNYLYPRVTLYHDVQIGHRGIFHSGVVLGSDGFGFANHKRSWYKVPQLGGVTIGNDVEIGANTTIDRGAIENTIIEEGVKLDNQIQIGHNVKIGAHTIIAGCTGIAGSTKIGKCCMIGGGVGIAGHLEITDGVILTAMTGVSHDIKKPGIYSSGMPALEVQSWRRNVVRFRHLDEMAKRIQKLESLQTEIEENHE